MHLIYYSYTIITWVNMYVHCSYLNMFRDQISKLAVLARLGKLYQDFISPEYNF